MTRTLHAVTGAFGYSGLHLSRLLIARGERVRNLAGHPGRPNPFAGAVEVTPLRFEDPGALRAALRDVRVLYNTYWVRFDHGASTFAAAVENSRALFRAAADAGVERIVHVSITNPSLDSPLPYFRGKALVESALLETGVPYAILRPAVFFGGRDVLINNIAWLLRRLPVFGVARGTYGLQPIHVEDFAQLAVDQGSSQGNVIADAVGPESFGFDELVRLVRRAVGSRAALVPVPRSVVLGAARVLGQFVRDVVLTPEEIAGLTANLLVSSEPPTGRTTLSAWIVRNGQDLGVEWASEIQRHYR